MSGEVHPGQVANQSQGKHRKSDIHFHSLSLLWVLWSNQLINSACICNVWENKSSLRKLTGTGITCKLYTKRPSCKVTVLTTTPLCHPFLLNTYVKNNKKMQNTRSWRLSNGSELQAAALPLTLTNNRNNR